MPVRLIRIDDRYIHGQVTVGWVRHYSINEIWVVDDKIAKNPVLRELQVALAPPNTNVRVLHVQEAIDELRKGSGDKPGVNIMIIVSNANDCLRVVKESNLKIDWVNAGQSAWRHGRIVVARNYAVDPAEISAFKEMQEMGIRVVYQMLPNDQPVDFYQLLRKKGII
ncbi:MAG: PTS sugar transporter subunit IIB [Desulfurococcaceae archaeon]